MCAIQSMFTTLSIVGHKCFCIGIIGKWSKPHVLHSDMWINNNMSILHLLAQQNHTSSPRN